jgi:hypothetical protein
MAGERRWALLAALCACLACSTALAEAQQLPRRGLVSRPSAIGGAATGGGIPAAASATGRLLQQAGTAAAAGGKCKALTKELLQGRARNNTVMLAVMNAAQWDFAQNWLHHTKRAGVDYYVVAATDAQTSERLAALGEPCFDRIDEEVAKLGEWCRWHSSGQLAVAAGGWRRLVGAAPPAPGCTMARLRHVPVWRMLVPIPSAAHHLPAVCRALQCHPSRWRCHLTSPPLLCLALPPPPPARLQAWNGATRAGAA